MIAFADARYDDNVTTLCSRNTRDDEFKGEMVHCYWDDIEPAPEEMKQQGEWQWG